MPIPRLMFSPVLEPKKIDARSLFQYVMSFHTNCPTQSKVIAPKAIRDRPSTPRRLRNFGLRACARPVATMLFYRQRSLISCINIEVTSYPSMYRKLRYLPACESLVGGRAYIPDGCRESPRFCMHILRAHKIYRACKCSLFLGILWSRK